MSLPAWTAGIVPTAARRLRSALWPIAQTAVAAGLAWYLARDVLGHHNPFFAPIAAAVCLWATNVVRAELAVEMVIGVTLGIGIGIGVHALLGSGPIAMGVAVLISLCIADLIGRGFMRQRPMFVNQTTMSAILILAFPHTGVGPERLFDALIGGGLAVVFSILLFPKNPLTVLRGARNGVLTALRDILAQIDSRADGSASSAPEWALAVADRLHRQLARLIEARGTAIQLARVCPRRWPLRDATRAADRQAAQLALLASSVLQLARTVTAPNDDMLARTASRARSATSPGPAQLSPTTSPPSPPRTPGPHMFTPQSSARRVTPLRMRSWQQSSIPAPTSCNKWSTSASSDEQTRKPLFRTEIGGVCVCSRQTTGYPTMRSGLL